MKPINDNVFFDTNILIYAYDEHEFIKHRIATNLITNTQSFVSTQVLQELINIAVKKLGYSFSIAEKIIEETLQNHQLHINTETTILLSCKVGAHYGFSFYDSLIVAAALESHSTILYSEDLQHNQMINRTLKIVNPFV